MRSRTTAKTPAPEKGASFEGTRFARAGKLLVPELERDEYLGEEVVTAIKTQLAKLLLFLDAGPRTLDQVQAECDALTDALNAYEEDIETVARDAIAVTIKHAFEVYGVELDLEEALRNRAW